MVADMVTVYIVEDERKYGLYFFDKEEAYQYVEWMTQVNGVENLHIKEVKING